MNNKTTEFSLVLGSRYNDRFFLSVLPWWREREREIRSCLVELFNSFLLPILNPLVW